ncbi:MAG: hypothetical protein HYU58_00050 [Proteobacteria bacterium]|nr:hypothetical protein [Pseudomonadota bacterium]
MPPVSNRKPIPQRPDGAMGEWRDGAFHFDSPDGEKQWRVDAYRSGVHADNWHLGQALDDNTRDVVLSGLGGATAPVYRGPDGNYRFANRNTIEPADVRALRQQSFQGVKLQDLKGPAMPGEDVIAARFAASRAANGNPSPAANDNRVPAVPQPKTGIGRFAAMAEAQKGAPHPSPQEVLQAIDDGIRLLANGATNGYADNVAAAGNALFGDGSFAEDYEKNRREERALTEAARARTGKVGAVIEAAPGMIPGYGDALSLVADTEQYIRHPETATFGNILGTVVTALPGTPNVLGATRKIENAAEDVARAEAKVAGKIDDLPERPKIDSEPSPELPVPKPDHIRLDLNDPASVDTYFKRSIGGNEGPDGHVISKHVGKTKEELTDRLKKEPRILASSSFPDVETAERVVLAGLQQNKAAIVAWMKEGKRPKLHIPYQGNTQIGMTVMKDGSVVPKTNAFISLKRDDKGGFYFFTAYPK